VPQHPPWDSAVSTSRRSREVEFEPGNPTPTRLGSASAPLARLLALSAAFSDAFSARSRAEETLNLAMSFRRRLKGKRPPAGWDLIEESIEDFEQQMKDAVAEEHEGKRKNELTWRIHRVHWEKNRFIFDLRYRKKVMSEELYNYLCREKVADQALISKWRKPGYENLCSLLAIQKSDTNFGTASICRVPMASRAPQQQLAPNVRTGCISCVSGDGVRGGPIWWNTPIDAEVLAKADKGGKKRAAEDSIEDPEVRKRLAALKGEMAAEKANDLD